MKKITVDAVGQQCPIPVVKATRALNEMTEPGILEVLVDNQCAVENITRYASNQGYRVSVQEQENEEFALTLTK